MVTINLRMHDGKNLLNITIVYDKGYSYSFSFLKTGFQSGQVENRDPGLCQEILRILKAYCFLWVKGKYLEMS